MNTTVFIISILLLQGICWWVGKNSTKGLKTEQDYFLGGKSVSFFPLMMTFLATQIGGGLVIGASQEASRIGWWVLFYPLGQVLGLVLLGGGIGKRLAQFQVSTVAQIFEVFYGSKMLKQIVSLLSIVSLFMVLVAQVLASKHFLVLVGVDQQWLFFAFWTLLITYTAIGGMKAVIATDIIQAVFFIAIFLFALGYALFAGHPLVLESVVAAAAPVEKFNGWLLMPLLFTFIEQDMGQRCFAAKSPRILSKAAVGAGLVTLFISLIPIYFGVLSQKLGVAGGEGSVLLAAVGLATNPVVSALMGCAVIAAILSTADSLINSIGANLSQDFFPKTSSLKQTRWTAALIGGGAMFVSSYFSNVVDVLILAYDLSVSALLVPLMAALFFKRGNLTAAALSIACGAVGFFLFRAFPIPLKEIAALALSLAGYGAGLLFVRKERAI